MEDRIGAAGGAAEDRAPGIPPVRAFVILGAVATIVPLTILATRPEAAPSSPPAPAASRGPDFSLTDAEAIAEFERLNDTLLAAYRERSVALAESVFTSDSPMLPRVRKEIQTLINSSVISLTRFEEVSTQVIWNSPDEITLTRIQVVDPRFETEDGDDATAGSVRERQRSRWTLRLERGAWRLHDAVITKLTGLGRR